MKVQVHEILATKDNFLPVSFTRDQEWLKGALGEDFSEEQSGAVLAIDTTLQMNGDEVLVRGKGKAKLNLRCSRCLEPAPQETKLSFDLLFAPRTKEPKVARGAEILLSESDLEVDFFNGEEIDLDEIAQEQLVLALPPYPLCKEDCLGLCPSCGKNLNEGRCACKPVENIDPRLAKLAQIRLPEEKDKR